MKITLIALFISLLFSSVQAQPVINSPTNDQVLYVGDVINITWVPRSNSWNSVIIGLQSVVSGTHSWISFSTPNDGSYTWNVSKWATSHTEFILSISDGGNGFNISNVRITIPNGVRPVQVPVSIKKVVSVEWIAKTNHTYQVQASPDIKLWTTVAEGQVENTNASALFYVDQTNQFFRVFDLTP